MNLPKRKPLRMPQYDYRTPNAYFITVCAANRRNLFWTDVGAVIDRPQDAPLTQWGRIVWKTIEQISKHYPAVSVDHFVVMPNHIHLLLQIHTDDHGRPMVAPTISTVVQQLKGAASKEAAVALWQKGFYDHVARNEAEYLNIWNYIEGNPSKWPDDELYNPL